METQKGTELIEDFQDHASNERTFLAWVRTAIAIVGIGLIVANIGGANPDTKVYAQSSLWLLVFGTAMIVAAGARFLILRKLIRSKKIISAAPVLLDMALAIVLIIMIAALAGFGAHVSTVLGK